MLTPFRMSFCFLIHMTRKSRSEFFESETHGVKLNGRVNGVKAVGNSRNTSHNFRTIWTRCHLMSKLTWTSQRMMVPSLLPMRIGKTYSVLFSSTWTSQISGLASVLILSGLSVTHQACQLQTPTMLKASTRRIRSSWSDQQKTLKCSSRCLKPVADFQGRKLERMCTIHTRSQRLWTMLASLCLRSSHTTLT